MFNKKLCLSLSRTIKITITIMNKQEFEKQIKACKSISKDIEEYTYGATKVIQKYANENNLNYGQGLEAYKELINNIKNKQK